MRFLSIGEAADLLRLTPRQIRHLGLGSSRTLDGNARVFDVGDLVVLRVYAELARRFARWDLSLWRARAAVLYLEPFIREAARGGRRLVVWVDDVRGLCELRKPSAVGPRDTVLRLDVLAAEMRDAITSTRKSDPDIWTGRAFTARPELMGAAMR